MDFIPGSEWRMRGGQIATVYPFTLGEGRITAYWPGMMSVFSAEGRYWFHGEESEFDLIEPVQRPTES